MKRNIKKGLSPGMFAQGDALADFCYHFFVGCASGSYPITSNPINSMVHILPLRDQGKSGERFSDTIRRIGFESAKALPLGDEPLTRKTEILGPNVVGGASC